MRLVEHKTDLASVGLQSRKIDGSMLQGYGLLTGKRIQIKALGVVLASEDEDPLVQNMARWEHADKKDLYLDIVRETILYILNLVSASFTEIESIHSEDKGLRQGVTEVWDCFRS